MSAFKSRHIVEVRNVISRSEYIALMGQQSGVAEEGHTIDALLRAGVPKRIARIALDNADGVDHSVVAWTRGDDADIASAMAVRSALRLCNQEGLSSASFGYVSCRALVEQWRGADLYGASSRESVLSLHCARSACLWLPGSTESTAPMRPNLSSRYWSRGDWTCCRRCSRRRRTAGVSPPPCVNRARLRAPSGAFLRALRGASGF